MGSSKPSEDDNSDIHDLDGLLLPLGGFGKYQFFNMVCIGSIVLLCAFSELGYILTTAEVKHRCLISECESENSTYSDADKPWLSGAINKTEDNVYDSCMRYEFNTNSSSNQCEFFNNSQYKCDSFVYETEEWTMVREDWGIQCDADKYKLGLVGSLNNAGQVLGGLYVGFLQDRYGRKLVIVGMSLAVVIIGTIKSFSINYAMVLALEFIEATFAVALFNGPFVLALEIVDPANRVLAGTVASVTYPVGEMILGLVQYLTFDWRNTIRICYLPFLLVGSFFWIQPESIRWLLDNGKTDEALAVLRKIAKMNGRELPEEAVKNILKAEADRAQQAKIEEKPAQNRFKELGRSTIMRWRLFWSMIVWICTIFVYFAMTMHSVGISDDKFVDYTLNAAVEIFGLFLVYFIVDRIGRKWTQGGFLVLCGIACIADAFMPQDDDLSVARLVLFLIGKFGVAGALFTVDIFTTELFPTFVRSTIMTSGLLFGKIATVLAPEIKLLETIYKPLPLLIFGCMALLGLVATLTFPETHGCNLPDTIQEAESLGKDVEKKDKDAIS